MFVVNEYKKRIQVDNLINVRQSFIDILYDITCDVISDKSMFSIEDFNATYLDEYELKTNCHEDIFNRIYIEIDQPLNYKMLSEKAKKNKTNKLHFPELYISIKTLLDCYFESLVKNLDSNYLVWLDDYSINIKATLLDDENQVHYYSFKIILGITHFNDKNNRGIMYKKNGGIEIEYPNITIDNFNKKNTKTKGLYSDIVLIFKNILLKDKSITTLPYEIIETLVYNVPDKMFISNNIKDILNIINYIRNNNIKNFKTIDEQDLSFVSEYRSMSYLYSKNAIKKIEKFLISQ